jgi:ABC-type spermidine/putrescine transport system permease subunit II
MTSVTIEQARRPGESALARVWAFVKHHVLTVYSLLAFVYLMLPIGIVIAFSFNNPKGRFNYV